MSETSIIGVSRRGLTLTAAAGLALAGTISIATASQGAAAQKDHKVWVCKYVDKPGVAERLKAGKQPIFVDWHSLTGQSGPPQVGDTFSDAQIKSVVVQVGGSNPGVAACGKTTPPTTPPTTPTTPPTTPTTPPTKTHTPPPHKTTNAPPPVTTPPAGGGAETVPGMGAPGTGGDGGSGVPVGGLVGSGLLLGAAGLVGHDLVTRRRRSAPDA